MCWEGTHKVLILTEKLLVARRESLLLVGVPLVSWLCPVVVPIPMQHYLDSLGYIVSKNFLKSKTKFRRTCDGESQVELGEKEGCI